MKGTESHNDAGSATWQNFLNKTSGAGHEIDAVAVHILWITGPSSGCILPSENSGEKQDGVTTEGRKGPLFYRDCGKGGNYWDIDGAPRAGEEGATKRKCGGLPLYTSEILPGGGGKEPPAEYMSYQSGRRDQS